MIHARATLVWCLVGAMGLMTVLSFALTGLTVDLHSNPWLPLAITGLLAASFFYRYRRPNPHLCAVTEAAAQMLLILLFGILLTYAAMTANFPYRDAEFYAIDQALGLDRCAYLDFVNSRPLLAELAGYSYLSLLPQFALVPMVLTLRAGTLYSIHLDNLEGLITFQASIPLARCLSGLCARCLLCVGQRLRSTARSLPQRQSMARTTSSIWWVARQWLCGHCSKSLAMPVCTRR